ncbi:hypothetical protein HUW46_08326 [Amycolatopsis sp. CA-230715]|nr:hypothetical protein HUW46_08326 [Amycolatopsis sp. CA-230715]
MASLGSRRSVVSEVALLCRMSEAAAERRTALADALTSYLPCALEALEAGVIDEYAASRGFEATSCVSESVARQVDSRLRFDVGNPAALRRAVNSLAMRLDPDGYERRRQKKAAARVLELRHGDHGSSTLFAELPADRAQAIYALCDQDARRLKQQGDNRTMDQLRVDALAARCLGGQPDGRPRAQIFVHVDLPTLLRLRENPAELTGYGEISPELAREIAFDRNSTWNRIVTAPITGKPMDVGRKSYRPPRAVRRYIHALRRTCAMPGCNRPAQYTDLDHATAWADGGGTDEANLRPLCRRHHLLRAEAGWDITTNDDGTVTVTTPGGFTYTDGPPNTAPERFTRGCNKRVYGSTPAPGIASSSRCV